MSKFKVGDRVRLPDSMNNAQKTNRFFAVVGEMRDLLGSTGVVEKVQDNHAVAVLGWSWHEDELTPVSISPKGERLRETAKRKAKRERAKIMRRLSPAGKRVVAMLQSGSAQDFGCQRENVINLAAAITGDKADDIRNALK